MFAGQKRKKAISPNRPSKRTRRLHEDSENEEEDLGPILTRIKEQEESELLAKKLQEEWSGTSGMVSSTVCDRDLLDDEAMARELAQQWEEEDTNQPSNSNHESRTYRTNNRTKKWPSSYSVSVHDNPPNEKLAEFRDLFTQTRKCTKCHKDVKSPRGHVMFTGDSDPLPPSLTMLMHAPCLSCRSNHCRGCFLPVTCPISCRGPAKNKNCRITACCAEGRAIAIFETLGGFDRQFINEQATSNSRALALAKKFSPKASVGPGGTGYGLDTQSIFRSGGQLSSLSKPSKVQELAAHWDVIIVRALNTLTWLLPSPYADLPESYDLLPHSSIGPLLSLSKIPDLLGSLLRNDSITDWVARNQIYHAIISLLRRMADCELTVQVLFGYRYQMSDGPGLESWVWGEGDIAWQKPQDGAYERVPPLYQYFKKLARQCEAFQTGALQMSSDRDEASGNNLEDDMIQATSLCGDIIAAKVDMERIMAVLGLTLTSEGSLPSSTSRPTPNAKGDRKGKSKGASISFGFDDAYIAACEKLAFKHVMLAIPEESKGKEKCLEYTLYNYAKQLDQTHSATRSHNFRFHLVKELAVMATSLPPGVWVRADEVRNDAIKIMIAGPEDTPYAGGLFEFDCFIPPEYPNTPPLLHLRTTGGGSVRFNPNLYNSGKVCLSLLGTWPGRPEEQWTSKSTLLQILVSIQSMILIDAPYYNEPGYGKVNASAQVSIAYNRDVSLNTVRWAIVDWLRDEYKNGIWKEVIASHFCLLHNKIQAKMVEWSKSDPRIRSYTLQGHDPTYRGQLTSTKPPTSCDLLREFELGMDRVRGWNITGEE
ncbi:hypothetical protein BDZ94DRAFT_1328678 [Collybia nuda]|uniref:UBC core domain-containing protein n=1 Tax=Collybia nuda TaxID=64659 RepID=A0A9P6CR68_9AGAR|nr:hypothetical protein BDZ94DRAFT_1328678 [Collybia nuda]